MLNRLGIATAVVVALYLLVTLMRGEPETETNAYVPAPTQAPAMTDKMPSQADIDRETRKLLAELKTIPVSEFTINLEKYERLLELHPRDATFTRKVAFFSQKLAEKRANAGY